MFTEPVFTGPVGIRRLAVAFVAGIVFGMVDAVVNAYAPGRLSDPGALGLVVRFVGLILNAAAVWGLVSVVAGYLTRQLGRAPVAGALSLVGAACGYYAVPVLMVQATLPDTWSELALWSTIGALVGAGGGLLGALIRRGGIAGAGAAAVVLAAVLVQLLVVPNFSTADDPTAWWARAVLVAAAVVVGVGWFRAWWRAR